jgi:hypothetical protein
MKSKILVIKANEVNNRIIFLCELKGDKIMKNETFYNVDRSLEFRINNYTSEFYNNPLRAAFEVVIKENSNSKEYEGLEFLKSIN